MAQEWLAKRYPGESIVNVVSCHNGFWHGIGTAKVAIYDDFRDTDLPDRDFISFVDYNIHTLNIKGSSVQNAASSVFNPYVDTNSWGDPF